MKWTQSPEAVLSQVCPTCLLIVRVGDWPFCPHEPTPSFNVQPDSIPGGMTVENMGPTPQTFYSKSEWKAAMRAQGLVQKVQHKPLPGTDKSAHTSRWI